jgi:hypothetical protein
MVFDLTTIDHSYLRIGIGQADHSQGGRTDDSDSNKS